MHIHSAFPNIFCHKRFDFVFILYGRNKLRKEKRSENKGQIFLHSGSGLNELVALSRTCLLWRDLRVQTAVFDLRWLKHFWVSLRTKSTYIFSFLIIFFHWKWQSGLYLIHLPFIRKNIIPIGSALANIKNGFGFGTCRQGECQTEGGCVPRNTGSHINQGKKLKW